jgi:hypothetical protein
MGRNWETMLQRPAFIQYIFFLYCVDSPSVSLAVHFSFILCTGVMTQEKKSGGYQMLYELAAIPLPENQQHVLHGDLRVCCLYVCSTPYRVMLSTANCRTLGTRGIFLCVIFDFVSPTLLMFVYHGVKPGNSHPSEEITGFCARSSFRQSYQHS